MWDKREIIHRDHHKIYAPKGWTFCSIYLKLIFFHGQKLYIGYPFCGILSPRWKVSRWKDCWPFWLWDWIKSWGQFFLAETRRLGWGSIKLQVKREKGWISATNREEEVRIITMLGISQKWVDRYLREPVCENQVWRGESAWAKSTQILLVYSTYSVRRQYSLFGIFSVRILCSYLRTRELELRRNDMCSVWGPF